MSTKICAECGRGFENGYCNQTICSDPCRAARKLRIGKEYYLLNRASINHQNRKYYHNNKFRAQVMALRWRSHNWQAISAKSKIRSRIYRETYPERRALSSAKYGKKNRAKLSAYTRQWRSLHRDHVKAQAAEYRHRNPEIYNQKARRYYRSHRNKIISRNRLRKKNEVQELKDSYVRRFLVEGKGIQKEDITPGMMESIRVRIRHKRMIPFLQTLKLNKQIKSALGQLKSCKK